ncbi:unnamed protein product [Coregonus sp. 'balchen']|nr:unnamed protein product [Coregonus sp. 'balchen']
MVAMASPILETSDDSDYESQRRPQRPDRDSTGPRQRSPSSASGGGDRGGDRPSKCATGGDEERDKGGDSRGRGGESPSADVSGTGAGPGRRGSAKAASGLVESLKLMSLPLSSQFHSLTGGGGGVRGGGSDHQDRPMWRMCMGGGFGPPGPADVEDVYGGGFGPPGLANVEDVYGGGGGRHAARKRFLSNSSLTLMLRNDNL